MAFKNWLKLVNLIQTILKKKDVWDIINGTRAESTNVVQKRKKEKNNVIASIIIKQRENSDFYINIIREQNLQQC